MKLDWSHWFYTLLKTVIGGVAATGSTWLGTLVGNQFSADIRVLELNQLWSVLLSSTLLNLFFYLKQSPLPEDTDKGSPGIADKVTAFVLIGAIAAFATGCKTPEQGAYRTIGTVAVSVDAAMNGWGDYVRAGKANPEQEMKVRDGYAKYQSAMRVAKITVASYKAQPDGTSRLNAAVDALAASGSEIVTLIQLFTKGTP
jgi:hypothetical protein